MNQNSFNIKSDIVSSISKLKERVSSIKSISGR